MLEKQADSRSLSFPLLALASWGIYLFYMQLVIPLPIFPGTL